MEVKCKWDAKVNGPVIMVSKKSVESMKEEADLIGNEYMKKN